MIAVGMRDERERLRIPRIEPDLLVGQINSALVSNFNHRENLRSVSTFDRVLLFPFHYVVKRVAVSIFALACLAGLRAAPPAKVLTTVNPLPVALSDDFQFRKTKLFELTVAAPRIKKSFSQGLGRDPNSPTAGIAVAPLEFERTYRLYGAITNADRNQRYG